MAVQFSGTVHVWNATSGEVVRELHYIEGHRLANDCPRLSRDGGTLFATGTYGVRAWDLKTFEHEDWKMRKAIDCFDLSPTDNTVALACKGELLGYDLDQPKPTFGMVQYGEESKHEGAQVRLAPNGVITGVRFNFEYGASRIVNLSGTGDAPLHVGSGAAAWSPDSSRIATRSAGQIVVWDAETSDRLAKLEGTEDAKDSAFAWKPDGKQLAVANKDGTIGICDASTGGLKTSLTGHEKGGLRLAWNSAGDRLASRGADATVKIWDVAGEKLLHILEGHTKPVTRVVWSPDGSLLVTADSNNALRVWDVEKGEPREFKFDGQGVTSLHALAFSPDNRYLGCGSDKSFLLWDLKFGDE